MSIHQMLMIGDDGALVCELSDEDDEDVAGVSLMALVDDWIGDQQLDGELHPYLDESLWVLKGFTEAVLRVVDSFEADDPHRAALDDMYRLAGIYVNNLLVALDSEATP